MTNVERAMEEIEALDSFRIKEGDELVVQLASPGVLATEEGLFAPAISKGVIDIGKHRCTVRGISLEGSYVL